MHQDGSRGEVRHPQGQALFPDGAGVLRGPPPREPQPCPQAAAPLPERCGPTVRNGARSDPRLSHRDQHKGTGLLNAAAAEPLRARRGPTALPPTPAVLRLRRQLWERPPRLRERAQTAAAARGPLWPDLAAASSSAAALLSKHFWARVSPRGTKTSPRVGGRRAASHPREAQEDRPQDRARESAGRACGGSRAVSGERRSWKNLPGVTQKEPRGEVSDGLCTRPSPESQAPLSSQAAARTPRRGSGAQGGAAGRQLPGPGAVTSLGGGAQAQAQACGRARCWPHSVSTLTLPNYALGSGFHTRFRVILTSF